MSKLFGSIKMTWWKVIVFAIVIGVIVGLLMCVPSLYDTSFRDIGITHEWWVLFALIVVVNCHKSYEAAFKCFLFFLISQPVIYGIEVLMHHITLADAWHFYYPNWFIQTLLTLPGGFIAYFCKKQNPFGAIVLGIGNTLEVLMGIYYGSAMIKNFPHHLLTTIFCFFVVVITNIYIQKTKKTRLISILTTLLLITLGITYLTLNHLTFLA